MPGILIIGGGLTGLFCALKLAPVPVTLLTMAPIGQGTSSAWAQGGIAAAISEGDTPEEHTADTMKAGAGLVDEAVTFGMAREASMRVHDLLSYGVPFDRDLSGHLLQSREAAHSRSRIVRVRGDMAGKAIMAALIAAVQATPSIAIREGYLAQELIVWNGRVRGVRARNPDKGTSGFFADATVLATGGIGHLYAVTTNPDEACGLGIGMAARAGAMIGDAEFVQFHPTAIDIGHDPAPLATEALRGEGAILVDRTGRRFMDGVHPDAELAPRDIVARAVAAEIASGRGAFLDAREVIGAAFGERFPTVHAACLGAGIDPARQPIPIAPAAHYHMGGVVTDARGRTSLPGLWAAGEVASTGVHGANRLASNSLLEAIVFAARAAQDVAQAASGPENSDIEGGALQDEMPEESNEALRRIMSEHVGVIRNGPGLALAIESILNLRKAARTRRLRNMADAALLIAVCAFQRRESRGAHFRSDYSEADARLAIRSMMTLQQARHFAETIRG